MAKLVGILLLLIIPLLVFNIAGLGGTGYLFETLSIDNPPEFLSRNPILTILVSITLLVSIGGVIAGAFLGRSLDTILANAGLYVLLGVFVAILTDYLFIWNEIKEVSQGFALIVISPILFAASIFIIEFIMKKD